MTLRLGILIAVSLAASSHLYAADNSAGKSMTVTPGAKASAPKAAKSAGGITAEKSASREALTDPAAAAKAFTFVGRSKGGKETKVEPSADVVKALTGEKKPSGDRKLAKGAGADPETGSDGNARVIVGKDERVQIGTTTRYPFSAIGYLEMVDSEGQGWSCTAALIGPSTVVTAANCLYNHADAKDPWRDGFKFWPALGGEDNAPFEGVEYDTAYVAQGFIDNYKDSYDDVWPYDVAVVTLKEPVGDNVGWLGYYSYPEMTDFQANVVGYPYDKDSFTMWRSTCDVVSEDVTDYDITYDCDVADGEQGAPIYIYDQETKNRYIVGINIGDLGKRNWGLRLYPALYEWIQTINK